MPMVVILQPRVANNNILEKPMIIILKLKIVNNKTLKKDLVKPLVRNFLNGFVKSLTDN